MLFYCFTDTQTKGNILAMQHKLQYNTGAAMQDNARQHWWYIISNTCNFAKMIHPDFFGEVAVRNRHHLAQKIDDCGTSLMKLLTIRMTLLP